MYREEVKLNHRRAVLNRDSLFFTGDDHLTGIKGYLLQFQYFMLTLKEEEMKFKKPLLWFGVAVPAVIGGVAVLTKKISSDNKPDTKNSNKAKHPAAVAMEQPDLDKDLNRQETESSTSLQMRKRIAGEKTPQMVNGKKIYTGTKGGKYYLNEKGIKVYIKK